MGAFFLVVTTGMFLEQIIEGVTAQFADHRTLYEAAFIATLAVSLSPCAIVSIAHLSIL